MIPLIVPDVGEDELDEIRRVFESGFLTQGPRTAEFEELIKGRTGAGHAIAASSATTALHLSVVALGIQPGDEVLLPDFTFPATANVVIQQGAVPVCVDICRDTFAMCPVDLERKITSKARAVIVVHPFGLSADMDPILAAAVAHSLPVIEDAACALGATYGSRHCGTMGTLGCFSFHPRKSITTGEGGMIVTDDDALAERLAVLRAHGGVRGEVGMEFVEAGFNYRLSDVAAAIGIAQLRKLDSILEARAAVAATLTGALESIPGIEFQVTPPNCKHTFQSFVVLLPAGADRRRVVEGLRESGVESTLGTYSFHRQPYFAKYFKPNAETLGVARDVFERSLTLPLFPGLSDEQVDHIADSLRRVVLPGGGA